MEEDFYEDDLYEDEAPVFDLDLLLSVAGGLGRYTFTDSGRKVYEKDPDCVGERRAGWGAPATRDARSVGQPSRGFERRAAARRTPPTPRPRPFLPAPRPAACLKDLQRFLRRDDPGTRDAFFKLGELRVRRGLGGGGAQGRGVRAAGCGRGHSRQPHAPGCVRHLRPPAAAHRRSTRWLRPPPHTRTRSRART